MIRALAVAGDTGEHGRVADPVAPADLAGLPAGFVWAASCGVDPTADAAPGRVVDVTGGPAAAGRRSGRRRAAPSAAAEVLGLARRGGVRVLEAAVPWRAVLPAGRGRVDAAAVGRVDRWVDEVLAAGATPWLVVHADDAALPDPVRDAGGWALRDTAFRLADHATAVHAALADRVSSWTTLDAAAGPTGAPGSLAAAHHRLLGHALALAGMRAQAPADHRFGLTLDLAGVRRVAGVMAADAVVVDGLVARWWLDAVLRGAYPADALTALEKAGERPDAVVADGDLALAARRPDRLGIRYPGDVVLAPAGPDGPAAGGPGALPAVPAVVLAAPGARGTSAGRHVTPSGLTALLARVHRDHPGAPPLLVSAPAGYVDDDAAVAAALVGGPEEPVADDARVAHLLAHLGALAAAARDGAGVAGFVAGPLLDPPGDEVPHGLARRDPAGGEPRARRSLDVLRAAVDASSEAVTG